MTLSIALPRLNPKGASTKDLLISILSEEWPLSAKEIHARVQKQGSQPISYQAVHKILTELCDKSVVSKQGKSFELDKNWLQSQKSFFERVASDYLNLKDKYDVDPKFKGTLKLHFNDYTKFVVSFATLLKNQAFVGGRPEAGLGVVRHAHWPFRFSFEDFSLLKNMMKNNKGGYALVKQDTPLDRWVIKQYLKGGFDKVKIVPKLAEMKEDLVIHGDGIIQIRFSDETISMMDDIYSKTSNLTTLFKEFVKHTFSREKVSIDMSITKNPQLAKTLQEHFMSYLDEN